MVYLGHKINPPQFYFILLKINRRHIQSAVSGDIRQCKMCSACIVWDLTCCCLCSNHIPTYKPCTDSTATAGPSALSPSYHVTSTKHKPLQCYACSVPILPDYKTYSPLQNMIPSIKTCQTFVAVLTLYSKDLFLDKACIVHSPTIFFVTPNIQVQIEVVLQKLLHFIL